MQTSQKLTAGPVVRTLSHLVQKAIGDGVQVQAANYNPPVEADVALVMSKPLDADQARKVAEVNYISSAESIGRFLNLVLTDQVSAINRNVESNRVPHTMAIEHTSLVPVYPLNLATFRSSVVGEWCRRSASFLGASTQARYFVQDSARQIYLVREQLRVGKYRPIKTSIGKGDHTIGRVFVEGVCREDGIGVSRARRIANELFPLGAAGVRRPGYTDWIAEVIEGWKTTFRNTGIRMDHFDRESRIIEDLEWQELLSKAKSVDLGDYSLPARTDKPSMLSYLEWSILYYCFALKPVDHLISVITSRQRHIQETAKKAAVEIMRRDMGDISIICVGDVLPNNKRDSIRNGRFTSVDDLSLYENHDIKIILESFLRCRSNTEIKLDFPLTRKKGRSAGRHRNIARSSVVAAVLLIDRLPDILSASLQTGDFTELMSWIQNAKDCRFAMLGRSPSLENQLEKAIDSFDTR